MFNQQTRETKTNLLSLGFSATSNLYALQYTRVRWLSRLFQQVLAKTGNISQATIGYECECSYDACLRRVAKGSVSPYDKQASYLSAAQGLVKLVAAAACVVALPGGHAIVLFVPQQLLLLDVPGRRQLQQRLGLEAAKFEWTGPPL